MLCLQAAVTFFSSQSQRSCSCSVAKSFATLCDPVDCSTPGSSVLQYLPEFAQIHVRCVGDANHLILSYPLLTLPSVLPSIRAFSSESFLATGDQSIGASTSVLPMNIQGLFPSGVIGLISLQSLGLSRVFFSNYSSKALILLRSAFFMVQRSDPYMTTRKTIALTI